MSENQMQTKLKQLFRPFINYRIFDNNYLVLGGETYLISNMLSKSINKYALFAMNFDRFDKTVILEKKKFLKFYKIASNNNWLYKPISRRTAFSNTEAKSAIQNAILSWKFGIHNKSLYKMISENKSAQCSYLVEVTWFVSQASIYLNSPLATTQSRFLRKVFKKWAESEKYHYIDLLKDLKISKRELSNHDPCHGSISLVSYLQYLGVRNPISFAVSLNLLEAELEYKRSAISFYEKIENKLGFSLSGFKMHFLEDLSKGHSKIWETIVMSKQKYTYQELSEILTDIHTTRHILLQWLEGLVFRLHTAMTIGKNIKSPMPHHFIRSKIRPESLLTQNR